MTETYFKAVRPDGTDFHTGTVRWLPPAGESLSDEGVVVTHPTIRWAPRRAAEASALFYLSVATVPTDCTGMEWPCRLARVERTGAAVWTPDGEELPHKRASWRWRVVEELDPTLALGPQGTEVAAIIDRAKWLTEEEAEALNAAWAATQQVTWEAAWGSAQNAACKGARVTARRAAEYAAEVASCEDAQCAVADAALATLTRDLIDDADYQRLAGPWLEVIGEKA